MEKCCGLFTLPWDKKDDFEKQNPELANAWKAGNDGGGPVENQPRRTMGGGDCVATGGYVTKFVGILKF